MLYEKEIKFFLEEDLGLYDAYMIESMPNKKVNLSLKVKDEMILAGLPFFFKVFDMIGGDHQIDNKEFQNIIFKFEGKRFKKGDEISLSMPFKTAILGERLGLNLLQRCSSIATWTNSFVELVEKTGVTLLDTRKTLPGLRFIEKYAVKMGGGINHRLCQFDSLMIKDNHKKFFGGIHPAIKSFLKSQRHTQNIIVEIHSLEELKEVMKYKEIHYYMLDNFSKENLFEAIRIKDKKKYYEISGGVTKDNILSYCIEGVDAISMGSLTYGAKMLDLSLKIVK